MQEEDLVQVYRHQQQSRCHPRKRQENAVQKTACFATEHESLGMRPSTENGGTRSTAGNRSSGGWTDS